MSVTWLQLLRKWTSTGTPALRLQKHTDPCAYVSGTLVTCDISQRSLTFAALEAGDFVESVLLYIYLRISFTYVRRFLRRPRCTRRAPRGGDFQDFQSLSERVKVASAMHRQPLPPPHPTPGRFFGTHFCWRLSRLHGHSDVNEKSRRPHRESKQRPSGLSAVP